MTDKEKDKSHNWCLRPDESGVNLWVCDSCRLDRDVFQHNPCKCNSLRRFWAFIRNVPHYYRAIRIKIAKILLGFSIFRKFIGVKNNTDIFVWRSNKRLL